MIRLALGAALLALAGTLAHAHEAMSGWQYPVSCCSGVDCSQIPAEAVRETRDGYVVTIRPGQHQMWPATKAAPVVFLIPFAEGTPSPDGKFHLCMKATGERLCFFAPVGGM